MSVATRPSFTFGNAATVPKQFFEEGPGTPRTYDIMRDGQRFIGVTDAVAQSGSGATTPHMQVVLNWQSALGARERR